MKLLRLVFLLLFIDYGSAQEMPSDAPLALVDGCPFELQTCQRLQLNGLDVACPHKLWLSHSEVIFHEATHTAQYSTSWAEIKGVHQSDFYKTYVVIGLDEHHSRMYIESKIACAPSIPTHTVQSRLNFTNKEDSELTIFVAGGRCGRGHAVVRNNGQDTKYCICPYGWASGPNSLCDVPIDPFGIAATNQKEIKYPAAPKGAFVEPCNILRVEGCPDEEQDNCVKLRFMMREPYGYGVYCPYKLWFSDEFGWDDADYLKCDLQTKEWIVKKGKYYVYTMRPQWRVQCAMSKPTKTYLTFLRVTNVKNEWGNVKPSLTHFCFHNWDKKCQNGGHCVHSHRPLEKQQPLLTYCFCENGFSGEYCEVKKSATDAIADNPACNLLLVESCPLEDSDCEPLRLNKTTQTIICPWTLWVSNTQSIHHVYSQTNHFTTNWTEIEALQCKDEKWEITFMDGKAQKSEVLKLSRKVMCAKNQPFLDADAFWEHKDFLPNRTNLASVHPSPIAYCPDETYDFLYSCHEGICVITYKNGKFEKACACNFGYRGEGCNSPYDPYGLDLFHAQADKLVREPLPGATLDTCNVLLAEGCPAQKMVSEKEQSMINCTKLRTYGTGVVCARTLWVSHPTEPLEEVVKGGKWSRIDSLECNKDKRWVFREGDKEELLPGDRIVACATEQPKSPSRGFEYRKAEDFPAKRGEGQGGWFTATYCFHNRPHRCETEGGFCTNMNIPHYKDRELVTEYKHLTSCICFGGFVPPRKNIPEFPFTYCKEDCRETPMQCSQYNPLVPDGTMIWRLKPRTPKPIGAGDHLKNICEPAKLEDGCTDDTCVKLKGNSTHAICNELLWLNYGGDFFMDWHEVSGVHCVDNQWQTECAKKIGHSKLMCSKHAPSSISSSLYLTIIISAVVIILLIALTCACCLLRSKQRRVQQAASLARTPHSSRCPSSTRHSDNARTGREEESDEK